MPQILIGLLVGTVPGAIIILIGLYLIKADNRLRDCCTEKVAGKVTAHANIRRGGEKPPVVEFTVGDKRYKSMLFYSHYSFKFSIGTATYLPDVQGDELYPIGSELDVYYDPKDPEYNYVLRHEKNYTGLTMATGGAVLLVIVDALSLALL